MASCAEAGDVLAAYLPISTALAADNLGSAKAAAAVLARDGSTEKQGKLVKAAQILAQAPDLAAARAAFKSLSAEVSPLANCTKGYVVMTCPMVHADWVQAAGAVHNPYFGKAMLDCGSPKKS